MEDDLLDGLCDVLDQKLRIHNTEQSYQVIGAIDVQELHDALIPNESLNDEDILYGHDGTRKKAIKLLHSLSESFDTCDELHIWLVNNPHIIESLANMLQISSANLSTALSSDIITCGNTTENICLHLELASCIVAVLSNMAASNDQNIFSSVITPTVLAGITSVWGLPFNIELDEDSSIKAYNKLMHFTIFFFGNVVIEDCLAVVTSCPDIIKKQKVLLATTNAACEDGILLQHGVCWFLHKLVTKSVALPTDDKVRTFEIIFTDIIPILFRILSTEEDCKMLRFISKSILLLVSTKCDNGKRICRDLTDSVDINTLAILVCTTLQKMLPVSRANTGFELQIITIYNFLRVLKLLSSLVTYTSCEIVWFTAKTCSLNVENLCQTDITTQNLNICLASCKQICSELIAKYSFL